MIAKRLFDFIFSALGLLFLSPLFLLIAILIKLDSKGPVFYLGKRIGKDAKPFKIYKFRTMVENAEQKGGCSTPENDPRLTKIGRFLRDRKLDELPQLFNILKGEMSFVGPRPEVKKYVSKYTIEEKIALAVKPGLTDYSTIRFLNQETILAKAKDPDKYYEKFVLPEKNKLRIKYARENNFWTDLQLIFDTLKAILNGKTKKQE